MISEGAKIECHTGELGQFVWRRIIPIVGTIPFPPHELMLMGAVMVWLRPKLVVEWGTNIGASARIFHELNVHYKIGAEIHSIDLPDSISHVEHPKGRRGILVRGLQVTLHQGDGPTVAASILKERKSVAHPLVFIDGDHSRESVLRDARMVMEVTPGAALLFHDTFYQPGASYNHGPYEAIKEVLVEIGESVQLVEAGLGCPGMTLVLPLRSKEVS